MATTHIWEFTESGITAVGNDIIDQFLEKMSKEKLITKEQLTEFSKYKVVISNPTFWGKLYANLFPKDKHDTAFIKVVKMVGDRE